jgi:small subunit ribosomal protein S21
MIEVRVFKNDIEGAIRLFGKRVRESGIMKELKERSVFMKPSEKRKRKQREARRRARKRQRKDEQS